MIVSNVSYPYTCMISCKILLFCLSGLFPLRFSRWSRLICLSTSGVSNSSSWVCGHQRLHLLCVSCSRLQSGRVWSLNEHTPAQPFPVLHARPHRLPGYGPTVCAGPGPNHRHEQEQPIHFINVNVTRPDSCFRMFSFFFPLWNP